MTHSSLRKFLPALGIPSPRAEDFWVLVLKMREFRMWLNHSLKILSFPIRSRQDMCNWAPTCLSLHSVTHEKEL